MAKVSICKRVWVNGDGEESRSPRPGTTSGQFRFANGEVIDVNLAELPDSVVEALKWVGLSERMQNAFAGVKGDVDKAVEQAAALYERFKLGEYVAEGKSAGPRISMLAEAILRAKTDAGLKDTIEAIAEKLKDKAYRTSAPENPQVKAAYEAIRAERAAAKAAKAAEAAGAAKKGEAKETLAAM